MFKTVGVEGLLKKVFEKIENVDFAFLYGSFAKNTTSANSDIDLIIIGEVDETKLTAEINKLEKMLSREINYTVYTKENFDKESVVEGGFLNLVLKDKIIFFKRKFEC